MAEPLISPIRPNLSNTTERDPFRRARHGGSGDAVAGVAIWGSPEQPKHSALTLLRSGLWTAPVRLGIPAWWRYSPRSNRLARAGTSTASASILRRSAPAWEAPSSTTCFRASMTTHCPHASRRRSRTTIGALEIDVAGADALQGASGMVRSAPTAGGAGAAGRDSRLWPCRTFRCDLCVQR